MTRHVSLVAIPEAMPSSMMGLYDVLGSLRALADPRGRVLREDPFRVEIVGVEDGALRSASGLVVAVERRFTSVETTDVVIVPSLRIGEGGWRTGRHPALVEWLKDVHARGAILCSACSGIFLLAETGLFDERDCTVHWASVQEFQRVFPRVRLHPERALLSAGERQELVSSGAAMSWHDLALHLIARYAGVAAAQLAAKFFALQSHAEGIAPYMVFSPPLEHGDAIVLKTQEWLQSRFTVANPVEEMVQQSGLAERSFKRRFTRATGLSPLAYVQRLRIEEGRRLLEQTRMSVDEISWQVGYEDPAFFRRLFRRTTGLAPGAYRRRFQVPEG